jgi:hypothetical protein
LIEKPYFPAAGASTHQLGLKVANVEKPNFRKILILIQPIFMQLFQIVQH